MTDTCGSCKRNPVDILRELQGADLSDKAKLVAILEAFGVTERDEVEAILEAKPSTIREAKAALKIQRQKSSAGNPAPEIQRSADASAGNPAQTPEIQRQNSSVPRAHATKELPSGVVIPIGFSKSPLPPKLDSAEPVALVNGRLEVSGSFRTEWLNIFGDDEPRFDLALIEVAGRVQVNSSRPLAAQVGSQLARIAADKRDRDARYRQAAAANARPAGKSHDERKARLAAEGKPTSVREALAQRYAGAAQ